MGSDELITGLLGVPARVPPASGSWLALSSGITMMPLPVNSTESPTPLKGANDDERVEVVVSSTLQE